MDIIYSLLAIILGFIIEFHVFRIVKIFGHLDWAEHYLGSGGSYTAWRLVGFILIIGGFWGLGQSL